MASSSRSPGQRGRDRRPVRRVAVAALLITVGGACSDSNGSTADTSTAPVTTEAAPEPVTTGDASAPGIDTTVAGADATVPSGGEIDGVTEPGLREELLAMMDEDQAEQTGAVATNNYAARTTRLAEILDEYGWPTIDMVGADGSTAAWVIAQHADLDPDLQQQALELLRAAAEVGQASRGDLAYLEDRVAAASGADQVYGTQMRCSEDGTPVPATPIGDEDGVDARRESAGLAPLADYLAEMATICADVGQG